MHFFGTQALDGSARECNMDARHLRLFVNLVEGMKDRVIKRQFGLLKVRFRGLAKNTSHIVTLFALSNLWMARKRLLAMTGELRPLAT